MSNKLNFAVLKQGVGTTEKGGCGGVLHGGRRGINLGGIECQASAADPDVTMVLGFHSILRGRMDIFGGDWHRPLSLQLLNSCLQSPNFLSKIPNSGIFVFQNI